MNHSASFDDPWGGAPPLAARPRTALEVRRHGLEMFLAGTCAFLAPFNVLRLESFYFTASDAFALAALLVMVLNRSLPVATLGRATLVWNAGFLLFGAMLLASSLVYGQADRGYVILGQYLYAYVILSHVLLSRRWDDTITLMKAFVVSVAVVCLHGVYVIDVIGERNTRFVSGNGRLLGLVERGNECASLIALSVPLLLWMVSSGAVGRRWLLIALPIFLYGIMLTGSNSGLYALVYAVAAFTLTYGSLKHILSMGAAFLFVGTAALTFARDLLPATFQQRVLGAVESGNVDEAGTFVGRMKLIYEALGKTDATMITGYGADQYREISQYSAPVHNTYLLIWVEAGFPALLGFVLMLIGAALTAIFVFRKAGGRLAACCTLTSVVLFALMLNAMPHLYGRFLVIPFLLGLAPSLSLLRFGPMPARAARFAPRRPGRRGHPA